MNASESVGLDELHAFADGRLDPARAEAVTRHLDSHPEDAQRVADWRRQNRELHALFDPILAEAPPSRLLERERAKTSFWPRAAAALLLLAVGAAGGWAARDFAANPASGGQTAFAQSALTAHRVYAAEVRHPVEVGVDQRDHLVKWLSNRLGAPIKAPQLENAGFALLGGRLLAAENGAAAQFMYESQSGERLTLFVKKGDPANRETAFRWTQDEQGNGGFYWIDGGFGYALVGPLPKARLQQAAHLVYDQLGR